MGWQHIGVNSSDLESLLEAVRNGTVAADEAVAQLRVAPFAVGRDSMIDHHRHLRTGMPEAVYGPGKSPQQVAEVVAELLNNGTGCVVLTRATSDQLKAALAVDDSADVLGATAVWRAPEIRADAPRVIIASAGTADVPVVDECLHTLRAHGIAAQRLVDVGVAGLHRLLAHVDDLQRADAIVVVAGMEGALASVVGGLSGAPVIAVPTSVGYGAALDGVTALLAMMASCASGVSVVGIDNGFGAAMSVVRMFRSRA